MGDRRRRRGIGGPIAATAMLGVALLPIAGCSGDDAAPATTTTTDPLSETAVDSCGTDVSALRSTAWAVDPATGAQRWAASVPLAAGYLLRGYDGGVLVPLEGRSVDVLLDPVTGVVLGYPPAGVHEVLIDSTGVATGVAGMQVVDDEQQPARLPAGGLLVEVDSDGGAVVARGLNPATEAVVWTSPMSGGAGGEGASRPVLYGDAVVIVGPAQAIPACN